MKMILITLISLFATSSSFMLTEENNNSKVLTESISSIEDETTFYPTISGPMTVTYDTWVTWEGEDPNENECGNCSWRWDISENSDFSGNSWIGADGPDSDNEMPWIVGSDFQGITCKDFYLRLAVIQGSNTYYSDTQYITVLDGYCR